jgi:hypothetical protein
MTYEIAFKPRQGVLMRILTEVTRRGIDIISVHADGGLLTIKILVTEKQEGQLLRAWRSTIDVVSAVLV